jgi:hypothetical protein
MSISITLKNKIYKIMISLIVRESEFVTYLVMSHHHMPKSDAERDVSIVQRLRVYDYRCDDRQLKTA